MDSLSYDVGRTSEHHTDLAILAWPNKAAVKMAVFAWLNGGDWSMVSREWFGQDDGFDLKLRAVILLMYLKNAVKDRLSSCKCCFRFNHFEELFGIRLMMFYFRSASMR
ncbi:hypothetical protein Bca4012_026642 [Brassica carinata]